MRNMEEVFVKIARRLSVCNEVISMDGIKFRGVGPYTDIHGFYTRDPSGKETINWEKSSLRLLEVTKDLNDEDSLDIRRETGLKNHISTKRIGCRWYKNLMRWEYMMIQFFKEGVTPRFEDLDEQVLIESFNTAPTARINVKKMPGGGICSDMELKTHIRLYGDLIIQQVQSLNPNVIFIGGCTNSRILNDVIVPAYPDLQAAEDSNWVFYSPKNDIVVIHGYNPTPIGKNDEDIYTNMALALRNFKQSEFYTKFKSIIDRKK